MTASQPEERTDFADGSVRITPAVNDATSYPVTIAAGALAELSGIAPRVAPAACYAIIADDRVATLHGSTARTALRAAARTELLTFPAGEASKTRETWSRLTDELLVLGVARDGCIVALGGGVTGDLAGFVAATYLRGIPLIQVPTSLLAMIDASVGGKAGVDVAAGKNLVGAFHQPRAVVIDPDVLRTLPDAQLRAGLAEAVKHGAIADAAYLENIGRSAADLLAREGDTLDALIRRSIAIKADVVAADPLERGRRAILNFGHTIGHAIERASAYSVQHGFAVAIGMVVEAKIGEAFGVTDPGTADAIVEALRAVGLPTSMPLDLAPVGIIAATRADKKVRDDRVRYALLARPGEPTRDPAGDWTLAVPDDIVTDVLQASHA